MKIVRLLPLFLLLPVLATTAPSLHADDPVPVPTAESAPPAILTPNPAVPRTPREIVDGFDYKTGKIVLGDDLAVADVPDSFRYLGPDDAETLLTKVWHNPSGSRKPLGLLLPAGSNLLAPGGWVVVIDYQDDGYVKDGDAAKIDYDDLLKQMKKGTEEANEERKKQGYPAVTLVGWAASPRYDAAAHKLYWAKEVKFGNDPSNTLNYNIRMLGRRGVLVLNAISDMYDLPQIEKSVPAILSMVDFSPGNRYADYTEGVDKVATYGLAALVAGGVAAKLGFFKLLLAGIIALKKFIVIGFIALATRFKQIVNWFRNLVAGKKRGPSGAEAAASVPSAPPQPPTEAA